MNTFKETLIGWKVMEEFISDGRVRQLGISNCYDYEYFVQLYQKAEVKPAVLQNRFYEDSGYDQELREFCRENRITYQSFWTLSANPHILESKVVTELAKKYEVTPAVILYRTLCEIGVTPLCGTKSLEHMKEDLALHKFDLSADEVLKVTQLFK